MKPFCPLDYLAFLLAYWPMTPLLLEKCSTAYEVKDFATGLSLLKYPNAAQTNVSFMSALLRACYNIKEPVTQNFTDDTTIRISVFVVYNFNIFTTKWKRSGGREILFCNFSSKCLQHNSTRLERDLLWGMGGGADRKEGSERERERERERTNRVKHFAVCSFLSSIRSWCYTK